MSDHDWRGWIWYGGEEPVLLSNTRYGRTGTFRYFMLSRRAYERGYAEGWHAAHQGHGDHKVHSDRLVDQDPEDLELEELIAALHDECYRDIVKYLVVHPITSPFGNLAFKAEHPAREYDLVGRGDTWEVAARDLLYKVISVWHREQAGQRAK